MKKHMGRNSCVGQKPPLRMKFSSFLYSKFSVIEFVCGGGLQPGQRKKKQNTTTTNNKTQFDSKTDNREYLQEHTVTPTIC